MFSSLLVFLFTSRSNVGLLTTDFLHSCEFSCGWTECCKTGRVSHPQLNDLLWLYIPLSGGSSCFFCCYASVKPSEFKHAPSNKGLSGGKLFKVSRTACKIIVTLEHSHSASVAYHSFSHCICRRVLAAKQGSKHKHNLMLKPSQNK